MSSHQAHAHLMKLLTGAQSQVAAAEGHKEAEAARCSLHAPQRNCAEDSARVKGKRPDFFLLSSRALLFKGEDKTSEAELEKALEELSTKLKEWGAAVHGKVLQLNPPHCQATSHAQCCMKSLCKYCACKTPRTL